MKIDLVPITVRELCASYENLSVSEEGITGYGGRLNIRPKYQREFVYDDKKRNAVMDTLWHGFPLNVMYWVRIGEDAYELLRAAADYLDMLVHCGRVYDDFRRQPARLREHD